MNKPPAYQWYPKDAESDEPFKLMTYEQQGIYRSLLDHQWNEGSLPADPKAIARLVPKVTRARFLKLWPGIAVKFPLMADNDSRRQNRRLEEQRLEQLEFSAEQSRRGRHGAAKRWERKTRADGGGYSGGDSGSNGGGNGVAIDSPLLGDSSADCSLRTADPTTTTAPLARRDFPQPVENLTAPSWRQALAIAHKVIQADPDGSANWTEAFKAKCINEGLDPYIVGGDDDPRPLYARAVDAVEAQRSKARRAS